MSAEPRLSPPGWAMVKSASPESGRIIGLSESKEIWAAVTQSGVTWTIYSTSLRLPHLRKGDKACSAHSEGSCECQKR